MQKIKHKEPKDITKENQQTVKESKIRSAKNYKNNHKTSNKMSINTKIQNYQ